MMKNFFNFRIVCSINPVEVNAFENALFPVFSIILQQDVLGVLSFSILSFFILL